MNFLLCTLTQSPKQKRVHHLGKSHRVAEAWGLVVGVLVFLLLYGEITGTNGHLVLFPVLFVGID